jgi:hypothetical protein
VPRGGGMTSTPTLESTLDSLFGRAQPHRRAVMGVVGGSLLWLGSAGIAWRLGAVTLVSGAVHPYEVVIDGEHLTLKPGEAVRRHLGRRALTIERVSPTGQHEVIDIPASAPFPLLPFVLAKDRVINPDGAAVLLLESTTYASDVRDIKDEGFGWSVASVHGQPHHVYDITVDYAFTPFPQRVDVRRGRVVVKTRLALDDVGPRAGTGLLEADEMDPVPMLRARVAFDHTDTQAIDQLLDRAPTAVTVAFLESRRMARPINVELWFALDRLKTRLQNAATADTDGGGDGGGDVDGDEEVVEPLMQPLLLGLEDGPADPCIAYLHYSFDSGDDAPSFEDARGCPPANAGLALRALARGDVDDARALIQATAVDLDSTHLSDWRQAMHGAGLMAERLVIEGTLGVTAATLARERAEADPTLLPQARNALGRDDDDRHLLDELEAYTHADVDRLLKVADEDDDPEVPVHRRHRFEVDLVRGTLDGYLERSAELNDADWVMVLAAALRHRHPDGAALRARFDENLQQFAHDRGVDDVTLFAAPPSVALLRRLPVGFETARAFVVAASEAFPHDEALQAEARRLCFSPEFPSLFLRTRPTP